MRTSSLVRFLCLAVAAIALAACSGGGSGDKTPTAGTEGSPGAGTATGAPEATAVPTAAAFSGTVNISQSEFKIQADPKASPDQDISFILRNEGTIPHQFIVIKTDLAPDKLPTQGSPSQVNLSDSHLTVIYQYPAYPAGQANLLHLSLKPGHYVFICNLPGHYEQGMRTDFSVSESNQGGGNSP